MQQWGPAVVGVEILRTTCFLAQIKSSLYPAGVLCLFFYYYYFYFPTAVSAPTWPSVSLSLIPSSSPELPIPGPDWVAILKPGLGPLCYPGWPGGRAFPVSRGTKCISLSVSVCPSVCACVCVSLAPCVSAPCVPPMAASPSTPRKPVPGRAGPTAGRGRRGRGDGAV